MTKLTIYGRMFPQNDPNIGTTEKFQVFNIFRQFFEQFFGTSFHKMVLKTQQLLVQLSSVGSFEEITVFFC